MGVQLLLVENKGLEQSQSLHSNLVDQGYLVDTAHTIETAAEKARVLWPNLIIFSPVQHSLKLSHFQDILEQIDLKIPYIVIDKEQNYPAPSDDNFIFVAPHQPLLLNKQIEEVISDQKNRFIRLPNLVIDCQQRQVLRNEVDQALTPKEFKLLHLLIKNHQQVLSRKEIMQTVWETDYMGDTRTLDVHIRWIREKIEENPSRPQRLVTVRGVGYRFLMHPD